MRPSGCCSSSAVVLGPCFLQLDPSAARQTAGRSAALLLPARRLTNRCAADDASSESTGQGNPLLGIAYGSDEEAETRPKAKKARRAAPSAAQAAVFAKGDRCWPEPLRAQHSQTSHRVCAMSWQGQAWPNWAASLCTLLHGTCQGVLSAAQELPALLQDAPGTRRVWYQGPAGLRIPASILSVDASHPPPFYALKMPGTDVVRETEGHRLTAMTPEEAAEQECAAAAAAAAAEAAPAPGTPPARLPVGLPQQLVSSPCARRQAAAQITGGCPRRTWSASDCLQTCLTQPALLSISTQAPELVCRSFRAAAAWGSSQARAGHQPSRGSPGAACLPRPGSPPQSSPPSRLSLHL